MKQRIYWIDVVKFVAVVFVILAHVVWVTEQSNHDGCGLPTNLMTINRIIASLGVPLFMMVSGTLLMKKGFETKADIMAFYRHGLFPLVVTAEIWIVVYCLIALRPFTFKELILNMVLVHKPEVHLWYVRVIVIYYLLIQFLNRLRINSKWLFVVLLALVATFTFAYNAWLIYDGNLCPTTPNRSYFCYLIYMAAGFVLARQSLSPKRLCAAVILLLFGGAVLFLTLSRTDYFLWYDNPLLAVMAISLFYIIRFVSSCKMEKYVVSEVSKMSYGIYLSHFLLIYVVGMIVKACSLNGISFYLALLAVLMFDFILIWGVKKYAPKVCKVVFRY